MRKNKTWYDAEMTTVNKNNVIEIRAKNVPIWVPKV